MPLLKKIVLLTVTTLITLFSFSQTSLAKKEPLNGWHLLDQQTDGYMGISLNKAYDLLKGRKSTTVIVAVIDSGIDTAQEDLQGVLWTNEKEIAGNGKDDDGNGYIDDVHGWNFCGSSKGENMNRNTYEISRVYHGWKNEFEGVKEKKVPDDKKFLYSQWKKSAEIIEKDYESASKEKTGIEGMLRAITNTSKVICDHLSVTEFSLAQVTPLVKNANERVASSALMWQGLFERIDDPTAKNTNFITELTDYDNQLTNKINRKMQSPEDFRGQLVKDNYTDINDRYYGNNDLKTYSNNHGTLVAGTIGSVRGNGLGGDGIADNVRLMAVRAVPGGDEHDKDVALAIRYAVDNGAKVINMSFGKPVSPYKEFVDDAVRYAASKGVLLVHGAGNDGKDISKDIFYPNPVFLDGKRATNYLTIGASGDPSTGGYAASFSNYSNEEVDIFAPGTNIYSTAANNTYQGADGTSLASPVAAGVAALLRSYFPQFSPEQIITIIKTSGSPFTEEVTRPGDRDKEVKFSTLSSSGRIINAYEAVKMALSLEKQNPKSF